MPKEHIELDEDFDCHNKKIYPNDFVALPASKSSSFLPRLIVGIGIVLMAAGIILGIVLLIKTNKGSEEKQIVNSTTTETTQETTVTLTTICETNDETTIVTTDATTAATTTAYSFKC